MKKIYVETKKFYEIIILKWLIEFYIILELGIICKIIILNFYFEKVFGEEKNIKDFRIGKYIKDGNEDALLLNKWTSQ